MADSKENVVETREDSKNSPVSYPSETIDYCIQLIRKIVAQKGGGALVSRDEIAVILGKAQQTLQLKISTCVQYGLLSKSHGKGYCSSPLFQTIETPEFDHDKTNALIEVLGNPPLYRKLIERYNGKSLPTEGGLVNILVSEFKVNKNSAERAAKIFFDNCQNLKVIDGGNRLKVISGVVNKQENPTPPINPPSSQNGTPKAPEHEDGVTIIPIPLRASGKKAFLHLPDGYTDADLNRIAKFINALKDED
jgi:hypothetical protein